MRTCEIRRYFAKTALKFLSRGPSPATTFPGVGTRIRHAEQDFAFPRICSLRPVWSTSEQTGRCLTCITVWRLGDKVKSSAILFFATLPKSPTRAGSEED